MATSDDAVGALPAGAETMTRTTGLLATSFCPLGEVSRITSLATQAPAPVNSTAVVRVYLSTANSYKVTFKATVAAKIRAYFTGAATVPINTTLVDPSTGKV